LAALALALLVIGLAFKMGAVPAHAWLPDVAEGAPAPAAAFLSVVPKIGAAIALAHLLALFPLERVDWPLLIAALSVATMTLGNLSALWQSDVRRLLGWSSVSQSGYALMPLAVLGRTAQARPELLFFLAGYAAANLALFAAVTQLRGRTRLGLSRPGQGAAVDRGRARARDALARRRPAARGLRRQAAAVRSDHRRRLRLARRRRLAEHGSLTLLLPARYRDDGSGRRWRGGAHARPRPARHS
jgi:hypothetical protein